MSMIAYIEKSGPATRILRKREVSQLTGLPQSSVIDLVNQHQFPQPVPIGRLNGRAVGWVSDEVYLWIDQRIAQRNAAIAQCEGIHYFTPDTE